jgi:hypothetical protein
MPEVSGALKWCQELKARIAKPMDNLKKIVENPMANSEKMERVFKKFKELLELLQEFSSEIYSDWCNHVGKLSDNNLEKNLIFRDPNNRGIVTNFDSQVKIIFKFK